MQVHTYVAKYLKRFHLALALALALGMQSAAFANKFCGSQGVWLQVLGSGGPDLAGGRSGASYLIWVDRKATILVDAGAGSAAHFSESGAKFEDLEVVLLSNTHPDTWADLPTLLRRAYYGHRKASLPVLAPASNGHVANLQTTFAAWSNLNTHYIYPAEVLASMHPPAQMHANFRLNLQEVVSTGLRTRNDFRNHHINIRSVPVAFGQIPAVAWHLAVQDVTIVLAGNASGLSGQLPGLAEGADMLVMHLNIEEGRRGLLREVALKPSAIGQIAAKAKARALLLGHRMGRTTGLETVNRKQVEAHYQGVLLLADDNECYGLEPRDS